MMYDGSPHAALSELPASRPDRIVLRVAVGFLATLYLSDVGFTSALY